jgi:hypothetical protein
MPKNKSQNVGDFLNRLKRHLKIKSDRDLSNYLGLSQNTISMWRQRESLDYNLIMDKCPDISLDYLISGVTPELISERNRILNYYQIPIFQMDLEEPTQSKSDINNFSDQSNSKIAELEEEIKKIHQLIKEKL